MKNYYIIDNNDVEDLLDAVPTDREIEVLANKSLVKAKDIRTWCENTLESFYEAWSAYGNPVKDLVAYISTPNLIKCIKTLNYQVCGSREAAVKYIKKMIK